MTATTVPARASHFICWRRSPWARRNRMTAEAAEPTMPIASRSTESPVSGSISAVSMPNGLSTVGWSSSGPGVMPVVMKPPAIPAPAHQATHRHRGDSRCPSGNSSSTNVQGTRMNGIQESVPYQAASSPSRRGPS